MLHVEPHRGAVFSRERYIYPKRRYLLTRTDDVTCQQTVIPTLTALVASVLTSLKSQISRKVGRKFKPDDAGLDARTFGRWVDLEQGGWECRATLWSRVIQDHRKFGPAEALHSHTTSIRYTTNWGRTWRQKHELIATLD